MGMFTGITLTVKKGAKLDRIFRLTDKKGTPVDLTTYVARMEVRPKMVRRLAMFNETDDQEFQASYGRVSKWANRHDKSDKVNYVAPPVAKLDEELVLVKTWFNRVRKYQ